MIGLCLWLVIGSAQAQEKGHYFDFNVGAGAHNYKYELLNGNIDKTLGYTFNLGYSYFFNEEWAVVSGIGIQSFRSNATLNYMTETPSVDTDEEFYVFRIYYNDWTEQQKVLFFDIPLGVSYKRELTEQWKLQASLGMKISLPIHSKYEITAGEIETRGFYPQYNIELFGLPQHNFKTINTVPSGKLSLNPVYSTFLDIGALYNFGKEFDVYLGVYLNYALNNGIDASNKLLYQEDGTYNNVLGSNQSDKLHPISLGLKVGITLPYTAIKSLF